MGREVATSKLERRLDGTFLLRVRPHPTQGPYDTHYALSLKYVYIILNAIKYRDFHDLIYSYRSDNTVKHMRVCRRPIESVQHYYLSESRFFRSVIELVSYYEKTSLIENFVGYDFQIYFS